MQALLTSILVALLLPVQGDVEAEIRAVHGRMVRAAQRLDAEALYAYVIDGPTPPIVEDGRLSETRAAALAGTTQGFRAFTSVGYRYTVESVTVLSPTAALWVGAGTASAALADGRSIEAPFAETIIFVKRDGEWRVLHAHRSLPDRR